MAGAGVGVLVAGASVGVLVAGAGVDVCVGVGVRVGVGVGPVAVAVAVGGCGVRVTVGGMGVRVAVAGLRVGVLVGHGVRVRVGEGVLVGVAVEVSVGVAVSVGVPVSVSVGVGGSVGVSVAAAGCIPIGGFALVVNFGVGACDNCAESAAGSTVGVCGSGLGEEVCVGNAIAGVGLPCCFGALMARMVSAFTDGKPQETTKSESVSSSNPAHISRPRWGGDFLSPALALIARYHRMMRALLPFPASDLACPARIGAGLVGVMLA